MMKRIRPPLFLARQSGNVLIMSIFIAAFLFFLSAALIAQNRQNILLILSEDNRMRASDSADAGLDLALHVMRHNPNWPDLLQGYKGEFASGGSWQIESIEALPNLPHILRIKSRGTCSFFAASKTRYVEEIPFATPTYTASSDNTPQPTHIFAYVFKYEGKHKEGPFLAALTPDMRWKLVCNPPIRNNMSVLAANQGPLFSIGETKTYRFKLEDINDKGEKTIKTLGASSQAVAVLKPNRDGFDWSDAKYPCRGVITDNNNKTAGASNSKSSASGSENLTKYMKASTQGLDYYGPTLEWYTTTGSMIAADKNKVYSHGIHYYYQGAHARMTGKGYQIIKPARSYQASCIVCYSAESDSWSAVVDAMQVTSRTASPKIVKYKKNNSPSLSSLICCNGYLYSFASGSQQNILAASGNRWQRRYTCNALSNALFYYQNKPLYHEEKRLGDAGIMSVGLNSTGILEGLYLERPAISLSSGSGKDVIRPKFCIYPSLKLPDPDQPLYSYIGDNNLAVCGKHIYAFVKMYATLDQPAETLKNDYPSLYTSLSKKRELLQHQSQVALAHYDGQTWQFWPNGLNDLAAGWHYGYGSLNVVTEYDDPTTPLLDNHVTIELDSRHLAAAKYGSTFPDTASPSISRYSVILDKDDN